MLQLTPTEKRWLEVVYYLLCNYILNISNDYQAIYDFIQGYAWTNMFNCDKLKKNTEPLVKTVRTTLTQYEVSILFSNPDCRLYIKPNVLRALLKYTKFRFNTNTVFRAELQSEVKEMPQAFPRFQTGIHITIYQFLLALRYIAKITEKMRL